MKGVEIISGNPPETHTVDRLDTAKKKGEKGTNFAHSSFSKCT